MSINLDNVTAITHNNKDVIKIEDSLGNTIWQSGGPTPTDEPMYFVSSGFSKKLENYYFSTKSWNITPTANRVWTDGTDLYIDNGSSTHYKFNYSTERWDAYTPSYSALNGNYIWTDGTDIYYDNGATHYKLDKSTNTWVTQTWTGTPSQWTGNFIWTDGTNFYYCGNTSTTNYMIDPSTHTFTQISDWPVLRGYDMWTDGTNIYHSSGTVRKQFDKQTKTWSDVTWTNATQYTNGAYTIPYKNKIYCMCRDGIFEVNTSTKTYTLSSEFTYESTFPSTSNPGGFAFNLKGRVVSPCLCVTRKQ